MSVVSISHLNLLRARKQMERAYKANDWEAVKDFDSLLTHQLTQAFDDPQRDNQMLVNELETILGLYAQMVRALPDSATKTWLRPEFSLV